MKTFLMIYLIGMLCKLFKHILQIGQLVGMFIQYMFLWLQCWKLIIPESLFITVGWIVKSATKRLQSKYCYWQLFVTYLNKKN